MRRCIFRGLDDPRAARGRRRTSASPSKPSRTQPSTTKTLPAGPRPAGAPKIATTRAFRARPLDNNKPLDIVRDLSLLDSSEGLPARDVVHNHAALDADNEKVRLLDDPSRD